STTPFPYTTLFRSEGELLLLPGVRLQGKGKERTRLIGCLRAASAGDSEITDLTVATPSPDVPAVLVGESDAHLTLEQVTLEPAAGPDGSNIVESQGADRKSTRLNSSHVSISYAVFCL